MVTNTLNTTYGPIAATHISSVIANVWQPHTNKLSKLNTSKSERRMFHSFLQDVQPRPAIFISGRKEVNFPSLKSLHTQ